MFIAYVDESGDPGDPERDGASMTYTLGCVMVDAAVWPNRFDRVIAFRRHIRRLFGVPIRAEIKAKYLIRNGGPFKTLNLTEKARFAIYRQSLRLLAKLETRTFGVVVDKARLKQDYPDAHPEATAWDWLLQRLERRSFYEGRPALLIHDESDRRGYDLRVRRAARKARRAGTAGSRFGTGLLRVPFEALVDDPIPRNSTQSYFVQLADLAAYAAFRRLYPPPARPRLVVPQGMWDEIGPARHTEVTTGQQPLGIVNNGGPVEE